jgi:serine/threonine-protein kinase
MNESNASATAVPTGPEAASVLLEHFEVAWRGGAPPRIDDFLAVVMSGDSGSAGPDRTRFLEELVKIDLEYRWRRTGHRAVPQASDPGAASPGAAGLLPDRPRLEDYLARYPDLGTPERLATDLIIEEYRVRRRWGDAPSRAEYEARFGGGPSLRALLEMIDCELAESAATWLSDRPDPFKETPARAAGSRFRVIRRHARGGLGEISLAHDAELNRQVALKEILDYLADRPESRSRFLLEAEVTGRLEHPGIVPVYGMGRHTDGRPYYAMRFIEGESLGQAIAHLHDPAAVWRGPGGWSMELRRLLGRFVAACNAVAYAHSRGVIHRDIKPANIMLGPFGETLVVDWGMAKVIGGPEAVGEDATALTAQGDRVATQPGRVLGTPAFMSPEQASGDSGRVGPASDVYSLGATLYALLTGRSAFDDCDPLVVVQKVLIGEYPAPRQVRRDAPPALEAVCLKAMALRPEDRYGSVRLLVNDIENWLAGGPVLARREPWTDRAGRWLVRHRLLMATTAAAALVALLGLTAVVLVQERANRTERRLWQQDEDRLRLAMGAIRGYYTGASEDVLLKQPEFSELRRKLLERPMHLYQQIKADLEGGGDDREQARAELAEACFHLGSLTEEVGSPAEAFRAFDQAVALLERLAREHPTSARYRGLLADGHGRLGALSAQSRRYDRAAEAYQVALALARGLARESPSDVPHQERVVGLLMNRGAMRYDSGQFDGAQADWHAALALLDGPARDCRDAAEYLADRALCLHNLGLLAETRADFGGAGTAYREALDLRREVARRLPTEVHHREKLAESLDALGHVRRREGRQLSFGRLDADGAAYRDAEAAYLEALDLRESLARAYPNATRYKLALAASHNHLGDLARYARRFEVAESSYQGALSTLGPLDLDQSASRDLRNRLVRARCGLGEVYLATGRPDRAAAVLRAAMEGDADELGADVAEAMERAALCFKLGQWAGEVGRGEEALDWLSKGIALAEDVRAKEPQHIWSIALLFDMYSCRGYGLNQLGRHAEALADYDCALELPRDADKGVPTRLYRAAVLARLGRHDQATALADELTGDTLDPGATLYNCACVYAQAAPSALTDTGLPAPARATLAEGYAAHAVVLLNRAHSSGLFEDASALESLKADPDLNPLRARPDFQDFLMDLAFPGEPFAHEPSPAAGTAEVSQSRSSRLGNEAGQPES